MKRVVFGLIAFCALGLVAAAEARQPPIAADTVIWGGPIYTDDDANPKVEAVAVRDGRIIYAGNRAHAMEMKGDKTQVIDLHGATLFPGFTDAHAHLRDIGERELMLNLEGSASLAEAMQRLKVRVAQTPKGQVIVGMNWIETHWPEARFPNRHDLDAVSPDNPVILSRSDGHALVANTAALKLAGITRDTPVPFGGQVLKDKDGDPDGMLVDAAMSLIDKVEPAETEAFKIEAYRAAFKVYSAYGWTGMHNLAVDYADIPIIEGFDARGEATLRVYNAVIWRDAKPFLKDGPRATPDGRVITRMMKFFMDGALGSRGAALFEPYSDAPGNTGFLQMKEEDALPVMEADLRRGIQVATHAIGDRGNHLALDWYAKAFAAVPPSERAVNPPRWRIEHAQIVSPADIPRFAQLGVIPSMQTSHAIGDFYFAPKRLGDARLKGAYAWKSFIDSGSIVPGGSDAPVERGDPRVEFYAAITRRSLDGFQTPQWHPEEAVDRKTALKMYTLWPAYASFRENELGMIKPGYRADFTVFDTDFMTADPKAILKAKALMTMVDGKVAYRAQGF
jgi:predicted amidohydrolase YtcJ